MNNPCSFRRVLAAPLQLKSRIIVGRLYSNMKRNNSIALSYKTSCYFIYAERPLPDAPIDDLAAWILVFCISNFSKVMYVSHAGELRAMRTFSFPQNKFVRICRITSLLVNDSVGLFNRRISGAIKTGDSKQMASSLKKRLLAKKFKLGRSRAKLMNLSLSFFSIKAVVLFI